MKNRLKFTLSLLLLLPAAGNVESSDAIYLADFETARWNARGSVFECTLEQSIPRYGDAVFFHQAGTEAVFFLEAADSGMQAGRALLTSVPPQWRHGLSERDLGYVDVEDGQRPVRLDEKRSRTLLAELELGMVPTLVRRAWYNEEEAVKVGISPVNFAPAYHEYRECASRLLPVNFDQIERSTVFWQVNQRELDAAQRRQLDNIISYAKADPGVYSFEINGFTDAVGAGRDNLELSRQRAFVVHNYLARNGISESMLATRYFGSTPEYRIIPNERSAADRDRNRRVTILIRRH